MKTLTLIVFALLLCWSLKLSAQSEYYPDTLAWRKYTDNTHKFKFNQVIIPAGLVAIGMFFQHNGLMTKIDKDTQEELQEDNHEPLDIDNFTQYAPIVGTYALNVLGVKGQHDYKDLTIISAMAYAMEIGMVESMKHLFREVRPDGHSHDSFPSGHTATAFTGATILWEEYKNVSPWICVSGYAVAAGTGFLRLYNNKHYLRDIIEGAGVGILSAKLAYWLYPVIFHHNTDKKNNYATHVFGAPYIGDGQAGCTAFITF